MAHTACLVCLVSAVIATAKNGLGRGGIGNGCITYLEHSRFSLDIYGHNGLKKLNLSAHFSEPDVIKTFFL